MRQKKILIADDDETTAETLTELCKLKHWSPIIALDGLDALSKIARLDLDVILADQRMPYMSGVELHKELTSRGLNIPYVLMSADIQLSSMCRDNGIIYFLKKPFSFDDLEKILHQVEIDNAGAKQHQVVRASSIAPHKNISSVEQSFLSMMIHEIRSPLQPILGYSDLLRMDSRIAADSEWSGCAEGIHTAAMRLSSTLDQLTAYFRSERMDQKKDWVDLNIVVAAIEEEMRIKLAQTRGKVQVLNPLPLIQGNAMAYEILFRNLIKNAIYYCERDPVIQISSLEAIDQTTIVIEDNGIGIDPKIYSEIFMPFKRFSPQYDKQGSGLGLSICKRVADISGIVLQFESQVGRGTKFTLTIPK